MVRQKDNIQVKLGLTLPDHKEARREVYEYFEAYRIAKRLLGREFVEHKPQPKPMPGYENAGDPDLIRVSKVHAGEPKGYGGHGMNTLSPQEAKWQEFVTLIDRKVARLPMYRQLIVKIRFLSEGSLPSDDEVYAKLYNDGWKYSDRYFDEEKASAVQEIAAMLNATNELANLVRF